ncbi:MAG: hypothetical protein ABMB14_36730 [Myxococcota bacterium]
MTRPDRDEEVGALQAGLKQLVTRLSEAELLLVRSWIEHEIRLARRPGLRLVRTPSWTDPDATQFTGTFVELAGTVRRRLHELPEDRLIVLRTWVGDRLRHRFGYPD